MQQHNKKRKIQHKQHERFTVKARSANDDKYASPAKRHQSGEHYEGNNRCTPLLPKTPFDFRKMVSFFLIAAADDNTDDNIYYVIFCYYIV
jgi:hypothetical protein